MRTLILSLILTMAAACLTGCGDNRDTLRPYGWSRAGEPFDSLTLRAERFYIDHLVDSSARTVALMREVADKNPDNRLLDSRATYWEGRIANNRGEHEKGVRLMRKALAMTDSAAYPYDYRRILWNLDTDYHSPDIDRYNHLLSELDFFLKSGDLPISGALSMEIGTFLNDIGDTENGIPYLKMADSLFLEAGLAMQVSNNRINHANALRIKHDTVGSLKLMREILDDQATPLSPYARDIVLGNLYGILEDTVALRKAYEIVLTNPDLSEARCTYENYFTEEALKRGDIALARHYHRLAMSNLGEVFDPTVRREYYRLHCRLFEIDGRMDSAFKYLSIAADLNDSINSSDKDIEIRNSNLAAKIAQRRLETDIEKRKITIIQLLVVLGLLLLSVSGGVFFYRKIQRQKIERMKDALRIERSNRRVMAMELLMKEKDNLFHAVENEMNELSEKGEISPLAANRITSSIKAHSGAKAERDSFIETFEQLAPDFSSSIRERYPALTDTDIRLAAFIALGLENKHIARVMAIRPESVKQARWRLRTKMGLAPGKSLDEAVRAFTSRK